MKKTITFAAIHFTIAFSVAYILTGDILLGSLIAMIEPMVNTVAFYFHERTWQSHAKLRSLASATGIKTTSFAVIHFSVAFSVAYLMTGSWLVGGVMAMIEPSINTMAFYFHEKVWQRKQAQHTCVWHCAHA